jgi:hypothetical protein
MDEVQPALGVAREHRAATQFGLADESARAVEPGKAQDANAGVPAPRLLAPQQPSGALAVGLGRRFRADPGIRGVPVHGR